MIVTQLVEVYTMKRILLITTGGTIASTSGDNGLQPTNSSSEILNMMGSVASNYDIRAKELFQLDSSNIQPEEWQKIAQCVFDEYVNFDGVVITHGTDTLGYTSSILSFMLQNIPVPIVLTGSQLPLSHPMTDALENLRTALAMAASGIPGIFVAFNRKVILGTRAVKVRTTSFDAFESVNAEYVATVDSRGLVIHQNNIPKICGKPSLRANICSDVFLLKLTPGINPAIFDSLISMKCKGLVIEAFGAGGVQFMRRDVANKLKEVSEHGIAVVVCSQCLYERSDFSIYEVGKRVLAQGVIEGYDMTSVCALTKLMWALAQEEDVRTIMQHNYAGEIQVK